MAADAGLDLSVIVPCHNVADTLGEQLGALAAQGWDGRWEVVVVDNDSTDGTVAVALASPLRGRLRIVTATEGQSVAYARNAGVRESVARSVAFCDGDDIVRPGWVAAMGNALRDHALVTGAVDASRINEAWLAETRPTTSDDRPPHFGDHPFARGNNTGMWRSVWQEVGGYDEEFKGLEDIEFSLRAAAAGVVPVFVPEAIVDYRYRPGTAALWKQGFFYGRGRSELRQRARALGLAAPSLMGGVKSWIWLVAHLPDLRTATGRYSWLWVLSNRIGALRGTAERLMSSIGTRT